MDTFCQRLTRLMAEAGIGAESMAKLLGITNKRMENILTEYSEADIEVLKGIARIFNVSEGYAALLTDDPCIEEPDFAKEVYVAKALRPGDGMVTRSNIIGTVYMNREDMHGKDYYALVATDDSMSKARIFKDDILIVRRQHNANNGDIVVAMVNDEKEIVRRYHRSGNVVTLSAEGDAMKYKTMKIDTGETKLLILGKVCEIRVRNF